MRFAFGFKSSQAPLWSSYYLRYEQLKRLYKAAYSEALLRGETPDFKALQQKLEEQCHQVNAFYRSECDYLEARRSDICATFELGDEVISTGAIEPIHDFDPQLGRGALSKFVEETQHLLLFARVNAHATQRILDKVGRGCGPTDHARQIAPTQYDFFPRTKALELLEWAHAAFQRQLESIPISRQPLPSACVGQIQYLMGTRPDDGEAEPTNALHRLITSAGCQKRARMANVDGIDTLKADHNPADLTDELNRALGVVHNLGSSRQAKIFAYDSFKKLPLHYAAEYGLVEICPMLLSAMGASGTLEIPGSGHAALETDCRGSSALSLAMSNRHARTAELLLLSVSEVNASSCASSISILPSVIAFIALEIDNMKLFESIIQSQLNINEADDAGQTLLCVAGRCHSKEATRLLLTRNVYVDEIEEFSGRQALCIACINGDLSIVELLVSAGADVMKTDSTGWKGSEHAAYRGHMEVVEYLEDRNSGHIPKQSLYYQHAPIRTLPVVTGKSLPSHVPWAQPTPGPQDASFVWVQLGTFDISKDVRAVQIDAANTSWGFLLGHESIYSLSVSATHDPSFIYEAELPILGQATNKPFFFPTKDVADMKLSFSLYESRSRQDEKRRLVGKGIALLGMLNAGVRPMRESLVRDHAVSLQDPLNLDHAGTVIFTCFVVTPHPPPQSLAIPRPWKFGRRVGGHRGSGKNKNDSKRLQIGENTAQSLLTAVELGASFVEFDVQLTKDLVPVVYHDFLLSETGTDSPMHTLSFEQFQYLSQVQAPRKPPGARSNSLGSVDNGYLEPLAERMALTYFNKVNGFKANTRGAFINERSCSLEEIFHRVPKSIAMNIELKYPMLFETDEWDMELLAIKTDLFVDTILDKVYQHASGRTILFSSFSPEICIGLSTKQRSFPVFFLSKTSGPRGEARAESIQQAIHFAKSWGLPGIVVESTPFAKCPRLVRYVKSAGLACMSFGALNNDRECAAVQLDAGVDAIVVDNVRMIAQISAGRDSIIGARQEAVYP